MCLKLEPYFVNGKKDGGVDKRESVWVGGAAGNTWLVAITVFNVFPYTYVEGRYERCDNKSVGNNYRAKKELLMTDIMQH